VPELFLWSRLAIWGMALFALLAFEPNRHPQASVWDIPAEHDLGYLTDVWARWDSGWFLGIAEHGYGYAKQASAFFPLYPIAVSGVGRAFFGHYVLGGLVVSLVCCLAAFFLLHRLAEVRLGADGARRAVLYLAIFPMALFLQAVYSESLYLVLVLAAFLLAERRHWTAAWTVVALATLTRLVGFALVPALLVMAWRSPDRRRALAGLSIVPALFSLFPIVLWRKTGDAWGFLNVQDLWHRHLSYAGPFGGLWDGTRAGVLGIAHVLTRQPAQRHGAAQGADYWLRLDGLNAQAFLFLIVFVGLTIVAWRRFGAPYGLFAAVSLAIPLSEPAAKQPLLSMSRFGLVIFPLFLALAAIGGRPRVHTAIVAVSSLMLGVAVVQWALWQWVA
jgi:mannosyltransferase PIG-V